MTILSVPSARRFSAHPATRGVYGAFLRRRAEVLAVAMFLMLVGIPRSILGQPTAGKWSQGNTGASFSVKVTGRGPAMIFVPGLTNGGAVWDDIVSVFADQYECHVFTLAGFPGQPPIPADSTWLPDMREAMRSRQEVCKRTSGGGLLGG